MNEALKSFVLNKLCARFRSSFATPESGEGWDVWVGGWGVGSEREFSLKVGEGGGRLGRGCPSPQPHLGSSIFRKGRSADHPPGPIVPTSLGLTGLPGPSSQPRDVVTSRISRNFAATQGGLLLTDRLGPVLPQIHLPSLSGTPSSGLRTQGYHMLFIPS